MSQYLNEILRKRGPLIGSELLTETKEEGFALWKACRQSGEILLNSVATRYLRLDKRLDGLARISPSIFREFLTYTVVGLREQAHEVEEKAILISSHVEKVSKAKLDLAYGVMCAIAARMDLSLPLDRTACVLIAGDIVYCMAHDVPRPERSTGRMVNGSDIDIVVVVDDNVPDHVIKRMDDLIYQEKYRLLITPHIREEIDYVVKGLDKVREQLAFEGFNRMLACKILQEGTFLYGSEQIFNTVKTMLRETGVTARLLEMERSARNFRKEAEERLLQIPADILTMEDRHLFYPSDESEEFE